MTRILRRAFCAALLLASMLPAEQRTGALRILVAPDHPDWRYTPGEHATFTIRAVRDGAPLGGLQVTWTAGPEMLEPVLTKTVTLGAEGLRVDAGTMKEPGFLRLIATIEDGGRKYRGLATAGFAPEKIEPVTEDPKDFDAFWQQGRDALAKIPIDAQLTLLPEQCTSKVNVYQVSLQNVRSEGDGTSRLFGIYAEPKEPGKYPALLRVPGAGVHKIQGLIKEAEQGAITLAIGIHGIPLTMDPQVYALLSAGALNGYPAFNLDARERFYYRRVYLGCVRANDFLTSRPNWDGKALAVMGGSQGGALSIVTAALDPRVKTLAAAYPALSDMAGYAHGRAGGWPHTLRNPANQTRDKLTTASYYDVVSFARRVKVPGLYGWGYNDETCPPTSLYAVYNVIQAPKSLLLALEIGHAWTPELADGMDGWIGEYLRTGTPAAVR